MLHFTSNLHGRHWVLSKEQTYNIVEEIRKSWKWKIYAIARVSFSGLMGTNSNTYSGGV